MDPVDFFVILPFCMLEKISTMKHLVPKLISLVLFWSIMLLSCKSNDPAPLGAQKNAAFLAGQPGKTKTWKLREFTVKVGSNPVQGVPLTPACFGDNLYTFSNNAKQDYAATEGTTKCYSSDAIESGTWAFTLDGLRLNVEVDNSQTPNGMFSPEVTFNLGDTTGLKYFSQTPLQTTYWGVTPYSAFVQKLDDNNLILEYTYTYGSTVYVYTMTYTPA